LNIDNAAKLNQIKIITEERDALAQAAIHTAQEEIPQEAAVTT